MGKAAKSQAPGVQGTGEQQDGVASGLPWVTPGRPLASGAAVPEPEA
jgi:hypothetical protein